MKIKKYVAISILALSPLIFCSENSKTNKNGEGSFLIEPTNYFLPSFPKIEIYNKKDTIEFQGNITGQINYTLPQGEYVVKVEPGIDSLTKEKGDFFESYYTKIKIKEGKNEMKILKNIENKLIIDNQTFPLIFP